MRNKILKFRAWDIHNQKFTYWTMNDLCTYAEKDEKPSALDEWQQDTGLLDRNGKEIYEGDILSDEGWNNVVIKWEDAQSFSLSEEYGQYAYDFTIIGNIYENPNLLQDSTKES